MRYIIHQSYTQTQPIGQHEPVPQSANYWPVQYKLTAVVYCIFADMAINVINPTFPDNAP